MVAAGFGPSTVFDKSDEIVDGSGNGFYINLNHLGQLTAVDA